MVFTKKWLRVVIVSVAAATVAIFLLAPVIYTTTYWPCNDECEYEAPHTEFLPAYQSLSCWLFGVGAGFSSMGAYGTNGSTYMPLTCPPKLIHNSGHSSG